MDHSELSCPIRISGSIREDWTAKSHGLWQWLVLRLRRKGTWGVIEVQHSIETAAPPEAVFAYWADWTNNPKWQSGMESCVWTSAPPLGVGSTYAQHASMAGKKIVSQFEVVELDPGRCLLIKTTESTIPLDITRRVEPLPDGGTRLVATIRGGPRGWARIFDPLLERMVAGNVREDYARLAEILDAAAGASRSA